MAKKTIIARIESSIRQCQRRLEKLKKKEGQARGKWNKGYQAFMKASELNATLKRRGTEREKRLRNIILSWRQETVELTTDRDLARVAIKDEEERLAALRVEYAKVIEQIEAERKARNEIVTQTFFLSKFMKSAREDREGYLNEHVYPRLIDEAGNLRSQIAFTHSDETRRVVAMVNTIAIVDSFLAGEAKDEIEKFFERIRPKVEDIDELTQMLYDLTRKILIEKTKFQMGPDLSTFLALELDREIFPELRRAQDFLKRSLRSEKSNSYIRLFERESRADKWVRLKIM